MSPGRFLPRPKAVRRPAAHTIGLSILGGALLAGMAAACVAEPGTTARVGSRTSGGANVPASGPSGAPAADPAGNGDPGQVTGKIPGGGDPASPSLEPSPDAVAVLQVVPATLTLYVPPGDGSAPLWPATGSLTVTGGAGTVVWQSSSPGIARVVAGGLVSAGRAGMATVTALAGTQAATASVTVLEQARLRVKGGTGGDAAWELAMVVRDGGGNLLFDGGDTAELTHLGDLTVEVVAGPPGNPPVAGGRWLGLTLRSGEINELEMPLNRPSLEVTQAGGPGSAVRLTGSGFGSWNQGHTTLTYSPEVSAAIEGAETSITVQTGSQALLSVPLALADGLPATRSLVVTVGGVPLAGEFRVVRGLQIESPPATLSVSEAGTGSSAEGGPSGAHLYSALAFDAAGAQVAGAALRWGILAGGQSGEGGSPAPGTMTEIGAFTPTAPGTATIAVWSGTTLATASLLVIP